MSFDEKHRCFVCVCKTEPRSASASHSQRKAGSRWWNKKKQMKIVSLERTYVLYDERQNQGLPLPITVRQRQGADGGAIGRKRRTSVKKTTYVLDKVKVV